MSTSSSTRRCIQFSLEEIKAATNQFDSTNILGKGGEAIVYFAEIYIGSNITPVAVKYLNALINKRDNSKEFESEIQILSKIQHPNIVSLIGYCNESDKKILVYEYMAKGCLSDYLKRTSDVPLSWLQRLNICLDVARGLQHLHDETDEFGKGIIHRDIKPGNILVGENWAGKVSDFGMLKLSDAGQDISTMVTDCKGTYGYFAPEYIKHKRVTRKIDVYSFGVVLFQVLCRKMPWDREDESYFVDEDDDLGIWAQKNVDAQIRREMWGDSLTMFTDIIGRSLQMKPGKRPTMNDVVSDLQKILLECQESENLAEQLDDTEEIYWQAKPGKWPTMDDLNLDNDDLPSQQESPVLTTKQFHVDSQNYGDELQRIKKPKELIQESMINDVQFDRTAETVIPSRLYWSNNTGSDFTANSTQANSLAAPPGSDIFNLESFDTFNEDSSDIFTKDQPKSWSFFQKLRKEDFPQKEFSLIDQDLFNIYH